MAQSDRVILETPATLALRRRLRSREADAYSRAGQRAIDHVDGVLTPYTATNEPKRGPFSWPSST